MIEYQILERDSAGKLIEAVRNFIAAGWEPLGGICATVRKLEFPSMVGEKYYQAMIKEPRKPTN